ncbi:unnamed protein product [Caenorhabditis angaria]|uniref:Uncharacterized protein n=1 Tax=Caenorhabditis angaria TaxID=860376 RepID=A0A9P1J4P1_9PELO|nr:unnamed protein product [Caenorhabditis angaria]
MNCVFIIVSIILIITVIIPVAICDSNVSLMGSSVSPNGNEKMLTTSKPVKKPIERQCKYKLNLKTNRLERKCSVVINLKMPKASSTLSNYLPSIFIFGLLYLVN